MTLRCCFRVSLRCLIVDDNPRFTDAARSLLEEDGISVVGIATSADEAVQLANALAPDVVLVDIRLGNESGFDVARRLVDSHDAPAPAVILVSTHEEQEFSDRIAASPAAGFLAKTDLSVASIRRLLGT
jgi:DNA-binding NarL/FixJ family response regulator